MMCIPLVADYNDPYRVLWSVATLQWEVLRRIGLRMSVEYFIFYITTSSGNQGEEGLDQFKSQ